MFHYATVVRSHKPPDKICSSDRDVSQKQAVKELSSLRLKDRDDYKMTSDQARVENGMRLNETLIDSNNNESRSFYYGGKGNGSNSNVSHATSETDQSAYTTTTTSDTETTLFNSHLCQQPIKGQQPVERPTTASDIFAPGKKIRVAFLSKDHRLLPICSDLVQQQTEVVKLNSLNENEPGCCRRCKDQSSQQPTVVNSNPLDTSPVSNEFLEPWPTIKQVGKDMAEKELVESRTKISQLTSQLEEANERLTKQSDEVVRLADANRQGDDRFNRLRSQYTELIQERSKLKDKMDKLTFQAMETEQLKNTQSQIEGQLNETLKQLKQSKQHETKLSQRLERVENEARTALQSAEESDVRCQALRQELGRKNAHIELLILHKFANATRELQSRLYLNQLIELKGNVRVMIRCHAKSDQDCVFRFHDNNLMWLRPELMSDSQYPVNTNHQVANNAGRQPPTFKAHRIFQPNTPQRAVFDEVSQLVTSAVDGYTVAIVAYGQTKSGKTHTLLGKSQKPGLMPRIARQLVNECHQRAPCWRYRLSLAIVQVYKERVTDLLSESLQSVNINELDQVKIHDNGEQILLSGASEVEVKSEDEIMEYIKRARKRRNEFISLFKTSSSNLAFIVFLRVRGVCRLPKYGSLIQHETHQLNKSLSNLLERKSSDDTLVSINRCIDAEEKRDRPVETNQPAIDKRMCTHGLLMLGDLPGFQPTDAQTSPSNKQANLHNTISIRSRRCIHTTHRREQSHKPMVNQRESRSSNSSNGISSHFNSDVDEKMSSGILFDSSSPVACNKPSGRDGQGCDRVRPNRSRRRLSNDNHWSCQSPADSTVTLSSIYVQPNQKRNRQKRHRRIVVEGEQKQVNNELTSDRQSSRRSNSLQGNEDEQEEIKQLGRGLIQLDKIINCLSTSSLSVKGHHNSPPPFRDTKLTQLLRPALTGDAKFILLVTLKADSANLKSSWRSLIMAEQAYKIAFGKPARVGSSQLLVTKEGSSNDGSEINQRVGWRSSRNCRCDDTLFTPCGKAPGGLC